MPESPATPFQALDAENRAEYLRLERLLKHGGQFQLIIISYTFAAYRQHLITRIAQTYPAASTVTVTPEASASQVIDTLVKQANAGHAPIHLSALEGWIAQQGFAALHPFNYRREYLAETLKLPLVIWLPPSLIPQFASELPDLWAWRTAVLEFHEQPVMEQLAAVSAANSQQVAFNTTDRLALEKRLQELQAYLKATPQLTVADTRLLLEVCDIEERFGHWDNAIAAAKTACALLAQAGAMSRELASAKVRIADILMQRGALDEALAYYQQQLVTGRQLSDQNIIASALFACARVYLAQKKPAVTGQEIGEMLAEAFHIVVRLSRPDGIVAIGLVLSQVLIAGKQYPAALEVLDAVEQVSRATGRQGGPMFEKALTSVQQLREQLNGKTAEQAPPA